jgi:hypothetical protein
LTPQTLKVALCLAPHLFRECRGASYSRCRLCLELIFEMPNARLPGSLGGCHIVLMTAPIGGKFRRRHLAHARKVLRRQFSIRQARLRYPPFKFGDLALDRSYILNRSALLAQRSGLRLGNLLSLPRVRFARCLQSPRRCMRRRRDCSCRYRAGAASKRLTGGWRRTTIIAAKLGCLLLRLPQIGLRLTQFTAQPTKLGRRVVGQVDDKL